MAQNTTNEFRISGRVIDHENQRGVANLRVEVWDKDLIFDDLVGSAVTDAKGRFEIEFDESNFKEIFENRQPDLFFKVFHEDDLIKSTEDSVLWNVNAGETEITLEIDIPTNGQSESFIVRGHVLLEDGSPLIGGIAQAFHVGLRSQDLLGEAATDDSGAYEIAYTIEQSQDANKSGPDIRIVAFSVRGERIGSSDIRFNAGTIEIIDLTVEFLPETTEYEHLLDAIASATGDLLLPNLTDQQIDFLTDSAHVDRNHLQLLVQAAKFTLETQLLSPAVFYGFLRFGQPINLKILLAQEISVMRETLLAAIEQKIIPSRISKNLEKIITGLVQLRIEQGVIIPISIKGRLLNEETDAALSSLSVKIIDEADSANPVTIDDTITDEDGAFVFVYLDKDPDFGSESNSRTFRFLISKADFGQFYSVEVMVERDAEMLELRLPPPPFPDPITLIDVADRASLNLPEGLLDNLESLGVSTIDDLRAAGPLDGIVELPAEPGEGVKNLEAHVRLSTLSSDIESNNTLINAGYTSAAAIAREPREAFFLKSQGVLGHFGSAKTHSQATMLSALMDDIAVGSNVIRWEPNFETSTNDTGDDLIDDLADLFPTSCDCGSCSNASSPLAYLADLLNYAQDFLKVFEEGSTVQTPMSVQDLGNRFHQPFADLPATCDQVNQEVNQVRICIEVLRRFLADAGLPGDDTLEQEQLAYARRQYLELAYTTILSGIGSSFDEIRNAHSADNETRQALADKLGILFGTDRPDLIDNLLLSGESLTEEALERLFGLLDTNRDPLQAGETPEFLTARLEFLRAAWREGDETAAELIIDPDLIGPGYLKEPVPGNAAYDLWQSRLDEIQGLIESLKEARNTASSDLNWVDDSVQQMLGITGEDLFALEGRLNIGENIDADLSALNLTFDAFSRLVRLRHVLIDDDPILDNESDDIISILVQVHKRGRFSLWQDEERSAGITHGPDYFIIAEIPLQFPPLESRPLPEWRATEAGLRTWLNLLQSRIEEEISTIDFLETALRAAEQDALPILRDGLITASGRSARALTEQLLIDCEADGCQKTTRVAQSLQTLQGILWSIRTGQLKDTHPDLELLDDNFDTAWRWLGSYETWRAAMSVFLYPENTLLPSLRPYKTPAFERLVKQASANRRINPDAASRLAREYEDYFLDIAGLTIGATCWASTRLYSGVRRGRTGRETHDLFYTFAKAEATQTIYWSSFDPVNKSGYAQSFWTKISGIKNVSRVDGAVAYRLNAKERYLYLFFTTELDERKQFYFMRLNLEKEGHPWDDEPTPIIVEDPVSRTVINDFTVVIKQSNDDQKPPEFAVRIPARGIYRGRIAQKHDVQIEFIAAQVFVLDNVNLIPVAMLPWRENGFLLFTVFTGGRQIVFHYHDGTGNQGGTKGRMGFLTYSSVGTEAWRGAFRWPQADDLIYAFWEESGKVQYKAIWGTDRPVDQPKHFLFAPIESLETIAPHSGIRRETRLIGDERLSIAYQASGTNGGLFRGVLRRVNTDSGTIFLRRSPLDDTCPLNTDGIAIDDGLTVDLCVGTFDPDVPYPQPPEPVDPSPPDLLQLSEQNRTRIAPLVTRPLEIVEQLSESELQSRRSIMVGTFNDNKNEPPSTLAYLEEAYYFVPVHLALQLQRRDHYIESLDWYRTVFDYAADPKARKIYFGLRQEESFTNSFEGLEWSFLDPLTPHAIASRRRNAYTRFTVLAIIRCFLQYADREFTRDTAESVARARTLYLTILDLLGESKQQSDPCEVFIIDLDREVSGPIVIADPIWRQVWDRLKQDLRQLGNPKILESTTESIRVIMEGNNPLPERLANVRLIIGEAKKNTPKTPDFGRILAERIQRMDRLHSLIQKESRIVAAESILATVTGNDLTRTVAEVTGISEQTLEQDKSIELPWLGQKMSVRNDRLVVSTGIEDGSASRNSVGDMMEEDILTSPRLQFETRIAKLLPLQSVNSRKQYAKAYLPTASFSFCIPVNPIVESFHFHAELNLYKIRTCRNIAGDERDLEPYTIMPERRESLSAIGTDIQINLPTTIDFRPTPYRYAALIERAKQLVGLAQQMEAAFLTALEKLDAEELNLLRARQEIELSQAGVRLQGLRLREAQRGVGLAELQRDRAQIQVDHYDGLLREGLIGLEQAALTAMHISAHLTASGAVINAAIQFGAGNVAGGVANLFSGAGQVASQEAQALLQQASFERRKQEWEFARNLARQDKLIGEQQTRIAQTHVRVAAQELDIAFLRTSQTQEMLEFLANKFSNAELYEFMSDVLEDVYRFFLQQATATAQLAAIQLAFERQQGLPAVIQSDYWETPTESTGVDFGLDINAPDRRGITGSARLLQDIFQLDQFAFETDQRKLQLTKNISLAHLSPIEFQRFRETGVIQFATPLRLYDFDYPGHYLRLIKRIRISMIALIPPSEGIKATLSTTGLSRVVISINGTFQTVQKKRPPESIALSSPINETGLFELTPSLQDKLLPFEGMGVDPTWDLQMPKAANQFDYNTIADVLISVDYTALSSPDYRQQIIQEVDRTISAEGPFSFRQELADQWYELNNPDQTDTPMVVSFTIRREDFPPNLDELRIQHIVLFFSRVDGASFEVSVDHLYFTKDGTEEPIEGTAAESRDGVISTRRNNAGNWKSVFIGLDPFGTWELAISNLDDIKMRFTDEEIEDILFVITYTARTPEWPV